MMPWPEVKGKPRSRNKDGRIRKKRRDAHDYKEREVQRPLPDSDEGEGDGAHSLSDQVALKIREGLREHRVQKLNRKEDVNESE